MFRIFHTEGKRQVYIFTIIWWRLKSLPKWISITDPISPAESCWTCCTCVAIRSLQSFFYLRLTYLLLFVACVLLECYYVVQHLLDVCITSVYVLFFLMQSPAENIHKYSLMLWNDIVGMFQDLSFSSRNQFQIWSCRLTSSFLLCHAGISSSVFLSEAIQINLRRWFVVGTVAVCCPVDLVTSLLTESNCWRWESKILALNKPLDPIVRTKTLEP